MVGLDGDFIGMGLEGGKNEKEGEKADDGDDGEDNGAEVLATLDFAVDTEDVVFVFVAVSEAINANGEGDDGENTDDDKNGFHILIIT